MNLITTNFPLIIIASYVKQRVLVYEVLDYSKSSFDTYPWTLNTNQAFANFRFSQVLELNIMIG